MVIIKIKKTQRDTIKENGIAALRRKGVAAI
jgi:hypothetical protein